MAELSTLVDTLSGLTVLEAVALIKRLEGKWDVSSLPPSSGVVISDPIPVLPHPAPMQYTITLVAAGENKLHVIKEIRTITGLGLKDAKDLVEGAPKLVKDGVSKEAADKIRKMLVTQGATVTMT